MSKACEWTPSKLIEVFCRPELRSGYREAGRSEEHRSDWYAGFCAYAGRNAYGPKIDGFDDGHTVWAELCEPFNLLPHHSWKLVQDPGDRQFPYSYTMTWRPPAGAEGIDARFCLASYSEGDFGIEVFDDEEAFNEGLQRFLDWDREMAG